MVIVSGMLFLWSGWWTVNLLLKFLQWTPVQRITTEFLAEQNKTLFTNKISMRSTVNRVPVPAHIRLPVCPSLMVLCCEHIISMKTMSKTHPIVSSMLQIGGFHVTSIDHNSNYREVWGSHVGWGAMLCPIQNSLMFWKILKLLNYSYFAKIMTGKPKIGILTNMTELYPFLESKKWYLLLRGFCGHVMSHDNHQYVYCTPVKKYQINK